MEVRNEMIYTNNRAITSTSIMKIMPIMLTVFASLTIFLVAKTEITFRLFMLDPGPNSSITMLEGSPRKSASMVPFA
ncbi:hypothetical protein D3C74_331700 [compost metagenome]